MGSDYDLYEVTDEVKVSGSTSTAAEALLLQLGHGAAGAGELPDGRSGAVERWRWRWAEQLGGGRRAAGLPDEVVRYENGVEVLKLEIEEAGVGAGAGRTASAVD